MKRRSCSLLLLLSLLFLVACSATPASFAPLSLAKSDSETDQYVTAEGIFVAVSVNAPLTGLEFRCKTAGEDAKITVKIFEADTDHDTTVASDPVLKETFRNPAEKMLWQFDSLPAGDYFIAFSDVSGVEILQSAAPSAEASGKILHYRNGAVLTNGTLALTLLCTKSEKNPQPALITFTYPVIVD